MERNRREKQMSSGDKKGERLFTLGLITRVSGEVLLVTWLIWDVRNALVFPLYGEESDWFSQLMSWRLIFGVALAVMGTVLALWGIKVVSLDDRPENPRMPSYLIFLPCILWFMWALENAQDIKLRSMNRWRWFLDLCFAAFIVGPIITVIGFIASVTKSVVFIDVYNWAQNCCILPLLTVLICIRLGRRVVMKEPWHRKR